MTEPKRTESTEMTIVRPRDSLPITLMPCPECSTCATCDGARMVTFERAAAFHRKRVVADDLDELPIIDGPPEAA